MARFIELIDNHNIKHAIRVAKIEQIYDLGVKGNETCICLTHDRIVVPVPYEDIIKMISKKGGSSWQ